MKRRTAGRQDSLFCVECGATELYRRARCRSCYRLWRHSRAAFGGVRSNVLRRDEGRCQGCGAPARTVHHRKPGVNQTRLLVTLCRACHAQVHHRQAMDRWLPPALVPLWREQHPQQPEQLQLHTP